jgi:carbon monoxide dehydrogenase subunit G
MSISVSRTVHTSTPLEACWKYLSDFSNTTEWDPGTVSCRQTTPGPIGVGTEFENVSTFRDRTTTLQYQVTTFDPHRRLVLEGQNKTVTSVDDLTFAPDGQGTEVVYTAHFTFHGLAKLAEPVLGKPLNGLADEAAAGLQRALDGLSAAS